MKNRNLVSLSVAFGFLSIGITGVLMYFGMRGGVTTVHVIFGLLFVAFAIFHVVYNWNSLKLYTRDKQKRSVRKEFTLVTLILMLVLIGSAISLKPFAALAHAGEGFGREGREGHEGREEGRDFFRNTSFADVTTNDTTNGIALAFIIQKNDKAVAPVIAIWVVDSTGKYVENLFVPSKVTILPPEVEDVRSAIFEGEAEMTELKPELLTEWFASSGGINPNFEGATPTENFFLNTKTTAGQKFSVVLEISYNAVKEMYRADVDLSTGRIFRLVSSDNKLLTRAILEVMHQE